MTQVARWGTLRLGSALPRELPLMHVRRVGRDPCDDERTQGSQPHFEIHYTAAGREFRRFSEPPHPALSATAQVSRGAAQAQAATGTNELSCRNRAVPSDRATCSW